MNIYADRGNLLLLERRCTWRGIDFHLSACGVGEQLDGGAHDFYYLGGGQDRDQRLCAEDLLALKAEALREAAARGAVVLGVCGGYQLLGRSYQLGAGDTLEGIGLVDVRTLRESGPRLIGNVAIALELDEAAVGGETPSDPGTLPARSEPAGQAHTDGARNGLRAVLAGFENHGGRSYLGAQERPLGRVIKGHGNDGRSGFEGVRRGNVIGTYLHGPLLPKNVWFADWLIAAAAGLARSELAPLEDELEAQAHRNALRAAGVRGS
jgi:CobQ-like glutamine amidotransferase family enzyme